MYVCMYVCLYACTYVGTYVCMYVCMYVRMYLCACMCVYVHIYIVSSRRAASQRTNLKLTYRQGRITLAMVRISVLGAPV